jgi:DNA sulfur modification protein DndE
MLPLRGMKLPKETEDQLRKLKLRTKVTPNVASRIAFFISVESNFRYQDDTIKLDGGLTLDKITWLGELTLAIEATLKMLYPNLAGKELEKAWASHVEHGIKSFRMTKSLQNLVSL